MQAEITALRVVFKQAKQSFTTELDDLTTQVQHLWTQLSHSPPKKQAPKDNKKKTITSNIDSIRSTDSARSSYPPFTDHQSRPTLTGANPSSKVEEQILDHNNTSQLRVLPSLHTNATVVLIGDSVMRGIDLSRSMPPAEIPKEVCVGGLMVAELTQWLAQQAPAVAVKNARIHVGVNDCLAHLSPIVISQQWKTLIMNCQHVFHSEKIQASGITPARSRHTANTADGRSNTNLQAVCLDFSVSYVDYKEHFTAPSSALK